MTEALEQIGRAIDGMKHALSITADPDTLIRAGRQSFHGLLEGREICKIDRPLDPGKRTLVMVPGLVCDGTNFGGLKSELEPEFNVVAQGEGEDESRWSTFNSLDEQAAVTASFVERVSNQHPNLDKFTFVGHSLGGLTAAKTRAKMKEVNPKLYAKFSPSATIVSPVQITSDFHVAALAELPGITKLVPMLQYLRAGSAEHRELKDELNGVGCCITSSRDKLLGLEMQSMPGKRFHADTGLTHMEHLSRAPEVQKMMAGYIAEAVATSAAVGELRMAG